MLSPAEIGQIYADDSSSLVAGGMVLRLNFNEPPTGVTVRWPCGTLQQASELIGNGSGTIWTDVSGATPPYVILPDSAMKFFRIRF
jgi:hypothetical protein